MLNMDFKRKLPIPMDIKAQFPITEEMQAVKEARDIKIAKVFKGESDKFILVIGPCSADRPEPVLRYVEKLADIQKKVEDKIIIIVIRSIRHRFIILFFSSKFS